MLLDAEVDDDIDIEHEHGEENVESWLARSRYDHLVRW